MKLINSFYIFVNWLDKNLNIYLEKNRERSPPRGSENDQLEESRSDRGKSTGSFNQLGGFYVNGKPLNIKLRVKIIHLASAGMRACDISKYLKVSHGCVSKIITR